MGLADLMRQTLEYLDSGPRLSEKIRKGTQGSVIGPLKENGQLIAMKVFDYTGRPDVARAIKEVQREYQSLKALSHPSIIRFIAFDHIPAKNAAYLRMQWASTELSESDSQAVDLGDIICHHDGFHSPRRKSFLPEAFIWHALFHLSAALSLCHHGIKIQRKKIVEKADTQVVLDRLTRKPPPDLRDRAIQDPRVSWTTERITFSVDTSHAPIIHRDIKPRNVLLCDPPWNDDDENWRRNVCISDDDIFCVYPVVLLGDFGLSVPLQVAETIVGSYGFTAPEVPLGPHRPDSLPFEWTMSCDIFSLGATIWNLMSLQTPPSNLDGYNSLPALPSNYSRELRQLVLECCVVDQSARPTAIDILNKCIQRSSWNETLVSPYGNIVSFDFQTALHQSWHDCLSQLDLLSTQNSAPVNQTQAIVDNSLHFMKLDQQDNYGRLSIFIAGAYFTRNVISKTHFLVPLPRTLHFVGRQYELRTLHSRMDSSGDGQVVLSLCGLGGIGKTQIAIQFAHQVIERDTGISVFWVNGASISAVQESYYRIAVQCGILSTDQINSFFMSRVKRWLESESAGRWLMIVDNVDNAYEFLNGEEAAGKAPLAHMPKCSHGSILYTTRDLGFAEQVSFSNNVIKVSPLSESESIALLKKIATSPTNSRSPDDQSSSDDLALLSKELGYLPLAIAQAAIYMDTFRLPVSEYLRYFEDQETARRVLNFEAPDFTRDKGWESLYSTWKISFDRIRERNTLAADVLALMSFFDPDTIPISLLAEEFTDKLLLSDAISTLRAMALISPNNEGRTYAIHRLIQLFMQNWLESQGDRQRFLSMSLRLLARLFPTDQNKGYNTSTMLLQHATKVLTLEGVSEEDSLVRAELLEKVSHYELKLGRLQNAEKFALEALQITSRLPGSTARDVASCQVQVAKVLLALGRYREAWELATESFRSFQAIDSCGPHTLSSMDNLAEVLRHQGEYREAEQMHQKTLELKIKLLDESHVDTLTSMANLASTYRNQGRWEEAEKLEVQVLETRKTKLGADHPDTLMSIANLASTYQSQGRWEEAKQLQVQVLEISKIKLGADHPDTLTSINNLASTYQNQGRWEEAEQLFVQVIETRKTKLGVDHPNTLTSINNLALTYQNQGRWEEAEQLFVQVIETRKTKLGVDHPNTLTSINNLALTYQNQGRWEEAEQLFVQVIETRKTKLGVDHPDTLTSITNLALTYQNQGRWEEAEQLFVQVIETRKTKLGVDHPDTLTSIINLALTYQNQGRWEEAEQLFVQVIETRKTKLGVDHPDTLTSIINLALTYQNQGRWEEAEQLFVQVIETRKTKLGVDHPDTLTSIINLALTYQNQGRWEEAEQLFVQVIETRKTKLGVDHPDTLTSIINLALTYQNQGRWEEAEQLFVQVIETRKTKLGVDHPDTLTSITNLASTYQNQGRLEEAEQLFMQVIETRKTKLSVDHPSTLTSMAKLAFA